MRWPRIGSRPRSRPGRSPASTCLSSRGSFGVPLREVPAEHLLELCNVGREVLVELSPLVECQWLLRVRIESAPVSIAETHMLQVMRHEVRRGADVAECFLVE